MPAIADRLLDQFHARTPIRTGSLIVTLFGDAIVPRGGRLSLASLVEIMAAFRIGDGLVRTALSRLVAEGLFERWKIGRTSHYRLSGRGRETFAGATHRIYDAPARPWRGAFDLVILEGTEQRAALRPVLESRGYGALTPDVLIAPQVGGAADDAPALHLVAAAHHPDDARLMAEKAWPIAAIAARYERFIANLDEPGPLTALGDLDALVTRTLLIHDYRRIVLRDPLLPVELLPVPWAGLEARRLCGKTYRAVLPAAERWLDDNARDDTGPLPAPDCSLYRRFGDLD